MTARTSIEARQIADDSITVAILIDVALTKLDQGVAGWPETTPGASPASSAGAGECPLRDCSNSSPCPIHDPDGAVQLTPTERLGITPDKARRDLDRLTSHIHQAARHLRIAATLTHRWGLELVDDTTVKAGLKVTVKEKIDEMWCNNCAKAGISTIHRIGRTECSFCEAFRLSGACGLKNPNGHPAPKALLDIHFSRRLDSADVVRTMTATYGIGWNRKLVKKGRKVA